MHKSSSIIEFGKTKIINFIIVNSGGRAVVFKVKKGAMLIDRQELKGKGKGDDKWAMANNKWLVFVFVFVSMLVIEYHS